MNSVIEIAKIRDKNGIKTTLNLTNCLKFWIKFKLFHSVSNINEFFGLEIW